MAQEIYGGRVNSNHEHLRKTSIVSDKRLVVLLRRIEERDGGSFANLVVYLR